MIKKVCSFIGLGTEESQVVWGATMASQTQWLQTPFQLRLEGGLGINQAGKRYAWEEFQVERQKVGERRKREKGRREKPAMMCFGGAGRIATQTRV